MSLIDLWELFQTGRSGGLAMGQTTPEEAAEKLGEPSECYQWGQPPFNDWFADYESTELWFREKSKRLWRIKVKHPSLQDTPQGTILKEVAPSMKLGASKVRLADIDQLQLVRFHTAIEACRHLGLTAYGTKYSRIKELHLRQKKNGLELNLAYMLDDVQTEDGEQDFDYYLYGIYVDDQRD